MGHAIVTNCSSVSGPITSTIHVRLPYLENGKMSVYYIIVDQKSSLL